MLKENDEWIITAELAGLELDEAEAELLAEDAEKMRELFLTMSQAEVDDLEPTTHALVSENRIRPDINQPFENTEQLIEAAPEEEDNFFLIPNVL